MLTRLNRLLAAVGPYFGMALVGVLSSALVVHAQTVSLSSKEFSSLVLDGGTFTAGSNYIRLIGGVDSTGAIQALLVDAGGAMSVDLEEFPNAAALADNTANPTTTLVGSMLHVWDGSTWDRVGSGSVAGTAAVGLYGSNGQLQSGNTSADNNATAHALYVYSHLLGSDGAAWDRIRSFNDGDAVDAGDGTDDGLLGVASFLYAWNGTTHDRLDAVDTGALVAEICDSGSGSTLCADVQTAGADNVANTENGLWTYTALMGFDGTAWDRVNVVTPADNTATTAGIVTYTQLFAFDGTNWDAVRDITPADNLASTDGLPTVTQLFAFDGTTWDAVDNVDTGALVTEVCDSGSGSTLCADVQTAGADNVANTENQLTTASFLMLWDGTTWDRAAAGAASGGSLKVNLTGTDGTGTLFGTSGDDNATSNSFYYFHSTMMALDSVDLNLDRLRSANDGDAVDVGDGTDDGLLIVLADLVGWNGTTHDRIRSFAGNASDVTEPTLGLLGAAGFEFHYDTIGDNWDRTSKAQIDGYYTPDAANTLVITVAATETCTADNALTAGATYIVQSTARTHCVLGADAATIVSDSSDMPVESPGLYYWRATAARDTACCIGVSSVHITPVDLN